MHISSPRTDHALEWPCKADEGPTFARSAQIWSSCAHPLPAGFPNCSLSFSACSAKSGRGSSYRPRPNLTQHPFDANQTVITVKRDLERLAAQSLVVGVEKRDHRPRLVQVLPRASKHRVLASELVWGNDPRRELPPELLGPRDSRAIDLRLTKGSSAHVGNPQIAVGAPFPTRRIWI
jgi:hypothetical protein